MPTYAHKTIGFGVPADMLEPHHYRVNIPRSDIGYVHVTERLACETETIDRAQVHAMRWQEFAGIAQREFNNRLKKQKLATCRWKRGENQVDRLLGKELCVLVWAIEAIGKDRIGLAARNWLALRPEERWWLFGMAAREERWRNALSVALAGK